MTAQDIWADLWGSSEEEAPIKSSPFNSIKLAQYFQRQFHDAKWSTGFSSINQKAMAGQLAQWKKGGATVEQVTDMINLYMSDPAMRGKNPGWQDFLFRREQLATSLLSTGENTQLDKYDQRMEEYDEEAAMAEYLARRNK